MAYSVDQLRTAHQEVANPKAAADDMLAHVHPTTPHETPDALGIWNGHAFVSWGEWIVGEIRKQARRQNDK